MTKTVLKLTLAIYRLTRLLPEGEILIWQLRKLAGQVMEEITLGNLDEAVKQIRVLVYFLKITQEQNWLAEINFIVLIKEYQNLLDDLMVVGVRAKKVELEKESKKEEQSKEKELTEKIEKPTETNKAELLSFRQKNILDKINRLNLNKFQAKDIERYFPKTSHRTFIRELSELCLDGYFKKISRGRGSFYIRVINRNQ